MYKIREISDISIQLQMKLLKKIITKCNMQLSHPPVNIIFASCDTSSHFNNKFSDWDCHEIEFFRVLSFNFFIVFINSSYFEGYKVDNFDFVIIVKSFYFINQIVFFLNLEVSLIPFSKVRYSCCRDYFCSITLNFLQNVFTSLIIKVLTLLTQLLD